MAEGHGGCGRNLPPVAVDAVEAMQLLRDVPQLESAGVVVRMPATWRANRPPRPQVSAKVGGKVPSGVGQDALLDFRMEVTLDGETLTAAEIRELLAKSDGLALVRGRWVEVDRERLSRMIEHFGQVERAARQSGLSLREAMRMLAGADVCGRRRRCRRCGLGAGGRRSVAGGDAERVSQSGGIGPHRSRRGSERDAAAVPAGRRALALSPRQARARRVPGRRHGTGQDHSGALAVAGARNQNRTATRQPSLLVAPASLLANWASELERFAPSLKALIAHPSALPAADLKTLAPSVCGKWIW